MKTDLMQRVIAHKLLLNGAPLFRVMYMKGEEIPWRFGCTEEDAAKCSDACETTLQEILLLFPEIDTLISLELDHSVMFQKGNDSGKWYDIHME